MIVAPPVAYDPKFNAATILTRKDGVYQTDEFFNAAPQGAQAKEMLTAMNPLRARIKVMCPSSFSATERQMVKDAAIEELGY